MGTAIARPSRKIQLELPADGVYPLRGRRPAGGSALPGLLAVNFAVLTLTAKPSSPDGCKCCLLPLSNDLTDILCSWPIIWVLTEACIDQCVNFCWAFLGYSAVSHVPNRGLLMSHYLPEYYTKGENVSLQGTWRCACTYLQCSHVCQCQRQTIILSQAQQNRDIEQLSQYSCSLYTTTRLTLRQAVPSCHIFTAAQSRVVCIDCALPQQVSGCCKDILSLQAYLCRARAPALPPSWPMQLTARGICATEVTTTHRWYDLTHWWT